MWNECHVVVMAHEVVDAEGAYDAFTAYLQHPTSASTNNAHSDLRPPSGRTRRPGVWGSRGRDRCPFRGHRNGKADEHVPVAVARREDTA